MDEQISCPVCSRNFEKPLIEDHVNKCLFLNTANETSRGAPKREASFSKNSSSEKRLKLEPIISSSKNNSQPKTSETGNKNVPVKNIPLAEQMRPLTLSDIVGQQTAFGPGTMIRSMLEQKKIPNMILWGPPGCGKTSLANIVGNICKEEKHLRYVKLSATMSGVNDVKEAVKVAKNEAQLFNRQTVLFMDEIHRFNKLQQDIFLPHVESGTITLVGATTENPSFSLNNALLSRCRVIVMEKLSIDDIYNILLKALEKYDDICVLDSVEKVKTNGEQKRTIEAESLRWLAGISDGDARVALGALEMTLQAAQGRLALEDIKNGIKRCHMVYDRQGDEHYNTISALHKAIRASDDNAALYWTTRLLHGGENPLYVARRLVRIACEDVGLADSAAIVEAVACLQGCQHVGMPECDVLLVQCAVRLARAHKSREVHDAMKSCQQYLSRPGLLPAVPLHLRNAPTKLMKELGYSYGYNLLQKDESGLTYMPEGMEHVNFFKMATNDAG